jgi:hypothetical protein
MLPALVLLNIYEIVVFMYVGEDVVVLFPIFSRHMTYYYWKSSCVQFILKFYLHVDNFCFHSVGLF